MGANIPGKPRVFMPYIGGVGPYRDEVRRRRRQRLPGLRLLRERGQGARLTGRAGGGSGGRRVGARRAPGRRVRQDDPQARDPRAVDLRRRAGARRRRRPRRPARAAARGASKTSPASVRAPVLRQLGADRLVEVVDRHRARDRDRARRRSSSSSRPGRSYSSSISPTISSRTSSIVTMPGGAAVLVDDDGELLARLAQLAQERAEVLGLRHHRAPAAPARRRGRRLAVRRRDEVADVHDADEAVERSARRPGSGCAASSSDLRRAPSPRRQAGVEPGDVGRRDHHVARLAVGEVEDVVQQLLLRARDHAGALGLVDQRAQLLGAADRRRRRPPRAMPNGRSSSARRALQHPHDRPQHLRRSARPAARPAPRAARRGRASAPSARARRRRRDR